LLPIGAAGTPRAREAAVTLLARGGWTPDSDQVLFAGNGRQAIAATIGALVPVGDRLGVEALTYPVVKGIAARLGITLVPLPMDEDGVTVEGISAAHRTTPLRAVYLQPALHNPLGTTMSAGRRADIGATLRSLDIWAIEDAIYGFLRDDLPPFALLAPERTVLVDSLSKRLAPGLSLGFTVPPAGLTERVATALRSGAWTAQRFAVEAATQWITDGTAATIARAKRQDAVVRQLIVRERLAEYTIHADPHAFHCWWALPDPWRADTFVAAAARRDIAITPAAAFTVGSAHAPNAVRLALASPGIDVLTSALDTLAALARRAPDDLGPE
jgi:DNA-binding transcriptional MocR family regulator